MDNITEKENINVCETVSNTQVKQTVETEISLPDYCPDVRRVLKCFVEGDVFSCGVSGDRVTADGEARIKVIYAGENGCVECYETGVPFSKYAALEESGEEYAVYAVTSTEYVNCRAVTSRKIQINSEICVRFCVSRIKSIAAVTAAEGMGIQTKKTETQVDMLVGESCKMFEMSETAVLDSGMPEVACVLKTDSSCKVESVKCVANKILIKGEVKLRITYRAESGEGETVAYGHTLPLSQIIELSGADENSFCDVCVGVSSVSITAKADSSGENRMLQIAVRVLAKIKAYSEKRLCPVTDCYSTQYEIETEKTDIELKKHISTVDETKSVRQTVDVSDIVEVKDVWLRKIEGASEAQTEKIKCHGSLAVGILYKNTDGEYDYTEKTLDIGFDFSCKETDGALEATPNFNIKELSASVTGSGKAEIKAEIGIYMPIYEKVLIRACTDIKIDEKRKKTEKIYPLTVYFSSKGEKLWDIARRYNTTVEAIQSENGITADETTQKGMVMIPSGC